jgi:NADPH:quinone reductase-like Zn-dependent oxidoreductase
MRTIVMPRLGGPDVLTTVEAERPTARPEEVLIGLS